jgi:hypothetical protein
MPDSHSTMPMIENQRLCAGLGERKTSGLDKASVFAESSLQARGIWQGVSSANGRKGGGGMKRYQAPVVIATYAAKELRAEAALVAVASVTTTVSDM